MRRPADRWRDFPSVVTGGSVGLLAVADTRRPRPSQENHPLLVGAAIVAGVLLFLGAYFVLPQQLVADRVVPGDVNLTAVDRAKLELQAQNDEDKLRNDVRTTAVQGLGGIVLLLGSYF